MQIEAIYSIYKNHPIISTDNRKIEAGCIFIALKGDKFDGNAFAKSALDAGAAYAIIDNKNFYVDERTILVSDTLKTLQELAHYHRQKFTIPFIAICGSNGKTTTKELVYTVLNSSYKTFATKGNLNNHIGVPLTILSIPQDTEIAIIEIGANHLKETADLCRIAEPVYGIVTNNGKDHLEGFGSIENVIKANAELFDYLKEKNGVAFVNTNYIDLVNSSKNIQQIRFGGDTTNEFSFETLNNNYASIKNTKTGNTYTSQLFGSFNADNIAAACCIGEHFKVPEEKIKSAIEDYVPGMNRSQILQKNNITFFVDCYNANPSSMKLAIESFHQSATSPKAVVLADMLELGEYSRAEHEAIVHQVKTLPFDNVILVGKYFGELKHSLPCIHFEKTDEAVEWFAKQNFAGYNILLKGSRGYTLEKLINF